jgi:peptidyl-prolyl cis-trans isomerase D
MIVSVFRTAKGEAGQAEGVDDTHRVVYRVTQVTAPTFDADAPQAKQIATTLQNAYADDLIGQYIARLENDYGVKINQTALNQVIGGAQ